MPDFTPHELVDIVDESDTALYQAAKSEAHAKGLLHRTVTAGLINSKGDWILVEQAADRQDASQYVWPMGGHVQAGEAIETAVQREVMEEMGMSDFEFCLIGKTIFRRNVLGRDENHLFILYEIHSDAQPQISHESVGYKTFSAMDLKQIIKERPELFGGSFHFVVKPFYPELFTA